MNWVERAFGAVALWLCAATSVHAQLAVLVVDGNPPRAGFIQSLRIQLPSEIAVIDAGLLNANTSTSERIEQALGAAELHQAEAAVWIEGPVARADGTHEWVLVLVGRRNDRAIVDVLRVRAPDAEAESVDRSLALKVSHVLSDVARGTDVIESALQSSLLAHSPEGAAEPGANELAGHEPVRLRGLLSVGGSVRLASGSIPLQPGLRAGVGAQLSWDKELFQALLRVHLWPETTRRSDAGQITLRETTPAIELGWLHDWGPIAFGARTGALLRSVEVEGATAQGQGGRQRAFLFGLLVGPLASLRLHTNLRLDASVVLETSLLRQRYRVNDDELGDTGGLRLVSHAELVGVLP